MHALRRRDGWLASRRARRVGRQRVGIWKMTAPTTNSWVLRTTILRFRCRPTESVPVEKVPPLVVLTGTSSDGPRSLDHPL